MQVCNIIYFGIYDRTNLHIFFNRDDLFMVKHWSDAFLDPIVFFSTDKAL